MLECDKSNTPNFVKELLKSSLGIAQKLDTLNFAIHQISTYKPNPGLSIFLNLMTPKHKLVKSPYLFQGQFDQLMNISQSSDISIFVDCQYLGIK